MFVQWESPRCEPLPECKCKAQERERGENDGGIHLLKDDRRSDVEAGRLLGFRMFVENKHAVWREVVIAGKRFA